MKRPNGSIYVVVVFLFLYAWWISDIPIGYYQFKQLCQKEGGLKAYSDIDKNIGWVFDRGSTAKSYLGYFSGIPFARFKKNDEDWFDIRYVGKNPWLDSSYEESPSNYKNIARYHLTDDVLSVPSATRLRKNVSVLYDTPTNEAVFEYTFFIFTWTNPNNTLFGMSGTAVCPLYSERKSSINSYLSGGN